MLWNFCVDGVAILRLRFKALEQYQYHLVTLIGVVVFLGMRTFLFFYPIVGLKPAILVLCVFFEGIRCVILTGTVRKMLELKQTLKQIFPFILLSESLGLVSLIFLLVPADSPIQVLNVAIILWAYMVQMIGLMWFSKKSAFKVFFSYIVYFFVTVLISSTILMTFNAVNLISEEDVQKVMTYIEENANQNK